MLAFLLDAYVEDEAPNAKGKMEKRTVLRPTTAWPWVKVAVLPLSRNPELSPKAKGLAQALRQNPGTSSSTTPAPSAAATAARTRSVRRTA